MQDPPTTTPIARLAQRGRGENDRPVPHFVVLGCVTEAWIGETIPIGKDTKLAVGRMAAAEISFPDDDSLSRLHASIESSRAGVAISDRKSNGVVINGDPVKNTVYLQGGDLVEFGEVRLRFVADTATQQAETLHRLVNIDELTGAYNHRRFQEVLATECVRAKRYQRPLSLILFRVDNLKNVNDTYGHPVGDEVLQSIAATASNILRESDLVARLWADEFAVLCLEANLPIVEKLALRLKYAIHEKLEFSVKDLRVSCSFGVAGLSNLHPTPEAMQLGADRALYRAKNTGRNAGSH